MGYSAEEVARFGPAAQRQILLELLKSHNSECAEALAKETERRHCRKSASERQTAAESARAVQGVSQHPTRPERLGEPSTAVSREIRFTIPLNPVTKKNSQRIVKCGKYHRIMPSKAYIHYEREAGGHLPNRGDNISRPCEIPCLFYMKTRRKVDLTNLLEAVDDVLVTHGVLADDNSRIIVSHDGSRVLYDPIHPRTEVTIRFLEREEISLFDED